MNKTAWIAAALLSLLIGCAATQTVPIAVPCPALPPAPAALTSSASTGPSLSERMEKLLTDYEKALADLLTKAQRQP